MLAKLINHNFFNFLPSAAKNNWKVLPCTNNIIIKTMPTGFCLRAFHPLLRNHINIHKAWRRQVRRKWKVTLYYAQQCLVCAGM